MTGMAVALVGEDQLCLELGVALILQSGHPAKIEFQQVAGGAAKLREKIGKMSDVADNVMPVLMVADADQAPCAVTQRNLWLPAHASHRLALRLAVREAEAWVLADHEGFSTFAQVAQAKLPPTPEDVHDPKLALLNLIRNSKRRDLREEMLPGKRSVSPVGLGYNTHLKDFVRSYWRADRAMQRAPSLAKAIPRVAELLRA